MIDIYSLIQKDNYLIPDKILLGKNIYEYDIRQANINMLYSYNMISEKEYYILSRIEKHQREIYIGESIRKEQRASKDNKSAMDIMIKEGIKKSKVLLVQYNHIIPDKILRIARDAVYLVQDYPLTTTRFSINNNEKSIEFVLKNIFTSFINLNKTLIFLGVNSDGNFVVDVKGIDDQYVPLHQKFLGFICDIVQSLEVADKQTTLRIFNEFYEDYVNLRLPIDYYREFNASSGFKIKGLDQYRLLALNNSQRYLDKIDINYNLYLLRELYSIILSTN